MKNAKNQLSILKAVLAQGLKTPVVFVGNPTSYCNDIHKYIAEKGIKKQVIFLKNIPEKDLAAIYQLANLSIYISVFEGFGLPIIESMACGCPVITSNVSCLPETAGGAAMLCTPEDIDELGTNIKRILEDSTFRDETDFKREKTSGGVYASEICRKTNRTLQQNDTIICTTNIKKALEVLKSGGVILYPTDTVWGIGCDATNPEAVKRIYEIKKRDASKGMLVLMEKSRPCLIVMWKKYLMLPGIWLK